MMKYGHKTKGKFLTFIVGAVQLRLKLLLSIKPLNFFIEAETFRTRFRVTHCKENENDLSILKRAGDWIEIL